MEYEIYPDVLKNSLKALQIDLEQIEERAASFTDSIKSYISEVQLESGAFFTHKNYMSRTHLQAIQGQKETIAAFKTMISKHISLIDTYLSGESYINESKLVEQIHRISVLQKEAFEEGYYEISNMLESLCNRLQKKLDKSQEYRAAAYGIYDEMSSYLSKIDLNNIFVNRTFYNPQTSTCVTSISSTKLSMDEKAFTSSMQEQFGIGSQSSKIMYKLYINLEKEYGDKAPQMFFSLLASFSYGAVEGTKNAVLWGIIANINMFNGINKQIFLNYGITEDEYEHLRYEIIMQHCFCGTDPEHLKEYLNNQLLSKDANDIKKLLVDEMEYKYGVSFNNLPQDVKEKFYQDIKDYCNKGDFSHMAATTATILNDYPDKQLGDLAGVYNGIFDVDKNAGYVGDVYGTNGNGPSIGNADYKADLDAVNLAARIKNGENAVKVLSEYYEELENGKTNRAKEFVINIGNGNETTGKEIIMQEAKNYFDTIKNSSLDTIETRKTILSFLKSVLYEKNDFEEIE